MNIIIIRTLLCFSWNKTLWQHHTFRSLIHFLQPHGMSCFILHVLFSQFFCSKFFSLVIASALQFWCIETMIIMIKIMIKSSLVFHAYLDIVICH